MRNFSILFCIVFIFTTLPSIAQKLTQKSGTIASSSLLKNANDSVQYTLGAYVGKLLLSNGFFTINGPLFLTGIQDVFNNKPRLIADSLQLPFLNSYRTAQMKQIGKALETQLFSTLKDKEGVGKLPSGVQYTVLKPGKGPRPSETDTVIIHFKGVLADGTLFEDSYAKKIPQITTPASLVAGVNECLQLMQPGAIWQLFIPSSQAWGEKGNGTTIPPNSAISILIELIEVRRK